MKTLFKLEGDKLYFENGVFLGEVLCDVDGFYKWWPVQRNGYLDEGFLLALGNFLQELNKKWSDQIAIELKKENEWPGN